MSLVQRIAALEAAVFSAPEPSDPAADQLDAQPSADTVPAGFTFPPVIPHTPQESR